MRRYFYAAILLMLASCTNVSDDMATWIGSPESNLLASYGAPDKSAITNDGKKIYTWDGRNGYGRVVCTKTFVIAKTGNVEAFSTNCDFFNH